MGGALLTMHADGSPTSNTAKVNLRVNYNSRFLRIRADWRQTEPKNCILESAGYVASKFIAPYAAYNQRFKLWNFIWEKKLCAFE